MSPALRSIVGLALLGMASLAPAQEMPVFRSEVESAYVDVFVSNNGRPVRGLQATDFELKDNDVSQAIELVSTETRPVRAVLVFDTSSSLAGEKLVALRMAAEAFLEALRAADEAALVAFSEEISWLAEPTTDKAQVRSALTRLRAEGATAVFDALYAALALSDTGGRSLVVLFTDGEDNTSILGAHQLRIVAERSNVLLHVVGLRAASLTPAREETDQARALREIAEASGGRFWTPESPERLREAFAAIAASMNERYVLRYDPQGVTREGWHGLTVRLRGAKGRVQVRRGYWVPPPR